MKQKCFWVIGFYFLFTAFVKAQPTNAMYTSGTNTYTIPAGYLSTIKVKLWGGGGGINGGNAARCGGGGGAYVEKTLIVNTMSGPKDFTAIVGAGGVGNNNGGASTVLDPAPGATLLLTAGGGGPGLGTTGGAGGLAIDGDINSNGGAGGLKGVGAAPIAGGGGGAAGDISGVGAVGGSATGNTLAGTGGVGINGAGSGGNGSIGSSTAGMGGIPTNGTIPGGGAGGKGDNGPSNGSGARGEIRFEVVSATALPVKFTQFFGNSDVDKINIFWQTASEINNDYFIIERYGDGENFEKIGKVKGVGNSSRLIDYNFIDYDPLDVAYYRLKQVDFDGTFDYSQKIFIRKKEEPIKSAALITLVNRTARIKVNTDKDFAKVKIYNTSGQVVKEFNQEIFNNEAIVFLDVPCNGLYFLSISNDDFKLIEKVVVD